MTFSGLKVQSILLRIAPTTPHSQHCCESQRLPAETFMPINRHKKGHILDTSDIT